MEGSIDIAGITSIIQSFPIYSIKSLLIDSFLCGYLTGKNLGENPNQLEKALSYIEEINIQLKNNQISFDDKLNMYNKCVNESVPDDPNDEALMQDFQDEQAEMQRLQELYGDQNQPSLIKQASNHESECEICLDKMKLEQLFPLSCCIHMYHTQCISSHVNAKIALSQFPIKCPSCAEEIPDPDIKEVLKPDEYEKFQNQALLSYFNKDEGGIQGCYTPNCGFKFENTNKLKDFICHSCQTRQCISCRTVYHFNQTCEEYQRQKLMRNPDENDKKFFKFAQDKAIQRCSRCNRFVERNEGCNHMTCLCGYEFCYLCGLSLGKCNCGREERGQLRGLLNVRIMPQPQIQQIQAPPQRRIGHPLHALKKYIIGSKKRRQ